MLMSGAKRTELGRAFQQQHEPAYENARLPNFVWNLGKT